MVVIVFTAFMLIADTMTLIHQHHESQKEHALLQKDRTEAPRHEGLVALKDDVVRN
jgi:hypothetical protein